MRRNDGVFGLRLGCLGAVLIALCGCGGGEDQEAKTSSSTQLPTGGTAAPGTSNTAPTIQGQPVASVLVGQTYSFQPAATDPNGDALTFSVSNLPGWAEFDGSTGRLSGTPTAADVATAANIVITASDGTATATLGPFSIAVVQIASGTATLFWTAPTQNTDGSPLQNLSGYELLYGSAADNLDQSVSIDNPSITTYMIENLTPGTWYFSIVAMSGQGAASAPSNIASKTVT